FAEKARAILAQNASEGPWGFKDPRSTLFLNFWAGVAPQAAFLFVLRSPWEIVDSLFRRGDHTFKVNPSFAVTVWMAYSQAILDFHQKSPRRCMLVTIDNVTRDPLRLVA